MNREELKERLELLTKVQGWSLDHNTGLTDGQRICLSQERAAIYCCLNQLAEFPEITVKRTYTLPPELEAKVQHIHNLIKNNIYGKTGTIRKMRRIE